MSIDSVIRNSSLSSFECDDSDEEIGLSCSGDDASESSDNSECGEHIEDDLQISFDQDFIEHIDDNVGTDSDVFNLTNPECVEMALHQNYILKKLN